VKGVQRIVRRVPPSSRTALVAAAAAIVAIEHFVPFGRLLLYPFTLLSTWVHEMGHGLAALAVGGTFERLEIFADASGLAYSSVVPGWRAALSAAGGLLAPPLAGGLILGFAQGPRRAGAVLASLAAALVVSLALWVRNATGLVSLLPLALAAAAAARLGGDLRLFFAQFIAVVLSLDTLTRMLGYVFVSTARVGGVERASDIALVARGFGGPQILWGLLVAAVALGLLAGGLWLAFRPRRPSSPLRTS